MAERVRMLAGVVGWEITPRSMQAALGEDPKADVTLVLDSPGGDAMTGMAVAGLVQRHQGRVRIEVDGRAASAASAIAVASDELVMAAGALLMVHEPRRVFFLEAVDRRAAVRTVNALDAHIYAYAAHYAANTPLTNQAARAAMEAETWYTADAAVKAGIATKAVAGRPKPPAVPAEAPDDFDTEMWDAVAAMASDPQKNRENPLTGPNKAQKGGNMSDETDVKPVLKAGETPGAENLETHAIIELLDGTQCRVVPVSEWDAQATTIETLTTRNGELETVIDDHAVATLERTVGGELDAAEKDGRITRPEREQWESSMLGNYETASPLLASLRKNPRYRKLADGLAGANGTGDALSASEREGLRNQGLTDARIDAIAKARSRGLQEAVNG